MSKASALILSTFILAGLLTLQYLFFGFLPAMNPNLSESEQDANAVKFILSEIWIVLLESLVGIVISYALISKSFEKKTKFLIIFIEVGVLLAGILFFSFSYVSKYK